MSTLTNKDFTKKICAEAQLNKETVTTVVTAYEEWIKQCLLSGKSVRLPFGKFCMVENRYAPHGMQQKSTSFHSHTYRPLFKFLQKFKAEVDRAEDDIKAGLE